MGIKKQITNDKEMADILTAIVKFGNSRNIGFKEVFEWLEENFEKCLIKELEVRGLD